MMHHPVHKSLKAAYSFYNASTSTPWTQLMNDALVTAKKNGFDVFNALDLMENKTFLENLKFGIGDGNLHYYIYNWRCPNMPSQHVGLVLQWFVFSLYLAVLLNSAKNERKGLVFYRTKTKTQKIWNKQKQLLALFNWSPTFVLSFSDMPIYFSLTLFRAVVSVSFYYLISL